jgi:4-hydroxybenzoate polyprenyltransferase
MAGKELLVGKKFLNPIHVNARKALLDLLRLVASTSVFLAINAQMVAAFSSLLYGVEVKPVILLIAFFATFSVYNMNRATDGAEDSINRPGVAERGTRFFLIPSITASVLCLLLSASVGAQALLVVITSFIVSIAYSVKLLPWVPRLKEIVGVKSVLVALSWGFTGALLPASFQSVDPAKIGLTFTYISIQLLVNTVLCDVCDVEGDMASGVRTLPIVLGLSRTRNLLMAVNSLLLPWLVYCATEGLFLEYMPALLFGAVYGYLIILVFSRKGRGRLLVELTVDGEWIPLVALMRLL